MSKVLVAVMFGMALPMVAQAFDVTGCSQVVPEKETGVLQVDLTTCGSSAVGVFVSERGELDLNGHAVASGGVGVHCLGKRCSVHGPGEIRNAAVYGIWASFKNARLRVEDVDIHDNGVIGIAGTSGKPRLVLERVTLHGNRSGAETIFKGRISGEDVDASNNSEVGIAAGARFTFKRLTILNTGGFGLICTYGGGKLIDSTVSGSTDTDILTHSRPRLVNSTCGTSQSYNPSNGTWGVCTND